MRTSVASTLVIAAILLPATSASPLSGQATLRGTVYEAESRTPLSDILVRVETTGSVTMTGDDGSFEIGRLPEGEHAVTFGGLTYRDTTLVLGVPTAEPIEVLLAIDPLEVEGIRVTGTSFETRSNDLHDTLDGRLARLLGHSRVATAEDVREHYGDRTAWGFLNSSMGIGWTIREDHVRVFGREVRPVVFIDEKEAWLYQFIEAPVDQFCRVEYYEPRPGIFEDVRPQLRAYTCPFLAKVVVGMETIDATINPTHDGIRAGPGGGGG